jgi:UDP-2-acetamido-2-deoxy-ribo-hexuluronate aminotransferase
MDTLQCAVVLGKLERFDWEIERRLQLGERYRELITQSGAPVQLLAVRPDRDCVWAQFTVFVQGREAVQAKLKGLGVPTAVHYPKPLHHQAAYAEHCCAECCPNSQSAAAQVMSLPMSADLSDAQQALVVAALAEATSAR